MNTGWSENQRSLEATALLANLNAAASGSYFALCQNNITPNPLTALADFVKCDFVGYGDAGPLATWVKLKDAASGGWKVYTPTIATFVASSVVAPQTAYGMYIMNTAKTALLGWMMFDVPYTFSASGDALTVPPELWLPLNTGVWVSDT